MKITDVSINNRTSIFILTLILIIVGSVSYYVLPREASPDIQIPFIVVSTPYFGVSPEDIESLITQPIEKELNSIAEAEEITSSSYEGFSAITVKFESGFDIDEALQKVRDKVEKAESELPADAEKPEIIEFNFSEFPIIIFNINGPQGLVQLKDIAEDMKDDIENIDGVLEVSISGGLEREVKVDVDINKLVHYNIRFDDVINAISNENKTIPGGSIDVNNKSFLVRVPGEFKKPYIIDDLVVKIRDGFPIYVRDVAEVNYDFKERNTYARLNGVEGVSVSISKRLGANIIEIADQVKSIIASYDTELPDNVKFTLTVDFSKDIKRSVKNLENNIFSGLVLVLLILFTLLGLRNAFFVAIAIPLSMLISFIVLSVMGITLNFIVLFSLILALGMLVDNAIVIIENIYKFLEEGKDLFSAAKAGAKEVAWPITTSTLTTLMAFAPILFWEGVVGEFMSYLPMTLIITLASSLFVGLVINPVVASKFMKLESKKSGRGFFSKLTSPVNKLHRFFDEVLLTKTVVIYEKFLKFTIGSQRNENQPVHKRNILGLIVFFIFMPLSVSIMSLAFLNSFLALFINIILGVGIIFIFTNNRLKVFTGAILTLVFIISLYGIFDHGVEFFPDVDPDRIFVTVDAPSGTNLDMTDRISGKIEKKLETFLGGNVREFVAEVGKSNNIFSGGTTTPDISTITVQFVDYEERKSPSAETMKDIREAVSDIAGAEIEVKKEDMGPPVGAPVNIEIIGEDFDLMGGIASRIRKIVEKVPGVVDLKDDYDVGRPEIRVIIDREKAALFSMNTSLIANSIRTAINGFEASKYRINEEEYDITVRLKESQRENVTMLKNLRINYNDNKGKTLSVPLSAVAEISYEYGPSTIRRKDLNRVITVASNVKEGFNKNAVLAEVKESLSEFKMPPGYRVEFTGQDEEQAKAAAFLMKAFGFAFLGIFLILVIQFNSLAQPLIIMLAVLISLIGVFMGLTFFALPFGIIMTGIGVISLVGVVVNNNIVLMDYINILRSRGYTVSEAVVRAGIRRFRPVTLTAITTILGLIPLTFGFGFDIYSFSFESGGADTQFWRSMGVAVIFGLLFGTVLTLVIVPVIYSIFTDTGIVLKRFFRRFFAS